MGLRAGTPEKLLGGLNEVEKKNSPSQLFAVGRLDLLKKQPRISVIGSRNPSPEGLSTASEIASAIVDHGGVVVSGLAKGIDTRAHHAAIEANGETFGVIGTPLNQHYPSGNEKLQRMLARDYLEAISKTP